jgi:RND family efflux transporter MFP subunit
VVVEPVSTAEAAEELSLTGTANARRISMVSPFSDGQVRDLKVDIGDQVEQGQLLARMDGVIAGHELNTAAAELQQARAELDDAIRRRDEAARVHADNLIAKSNYESVIAEVEIQQAVVARLESIHAGQEEIVRRLEIRAPFAGVISQKLVEIGQWVPRSQPMFELVDAEVLRVDVPVPQVYFGTIRPGTPALVRFDALANVSIESAVTTRVPISDPSARTFLARIEIDNADAQFAPGMSTRVVLRHGGGGEGMALQVPRDALLRNANGNHRLWLADGDGDELEARAVAITIHRFNGRFAVISPADGEQQIEVGDRAIIRGNEALSSGQSVRIVDSGY